MFCDTKCIIDREKYADLYTFFGFNFCPDLADDCNTSGHLSLINRGTLRLEMHFKKALPETINVLIFAEYDNIIEINKDRNAITDFS